MSLQLRIEMVLLALIVVIIVFTAVNKKKFRLQYSLLWLLVSATMLIVALFPGIVNWLCELTSIQTPSNLIYLLGILALILISFHLTGIVSKQADQIQRLTQMLSIQHIAKVSDENKEDSHKHADTKQD